jgi:hypothetical protein
VKNRANKKTAAANILLILAAILSAGLLAEVGLRLAGVSHPRFYRSDEHTGTSLRPGIETWELNEGEREGFSVLNLAPEFQAYAERHKVFLHGFEPNPGGGHWNKNGHRLAGKAIAARLCREIAARGPGTPRAVYPRLAEDFDNKREADHNTRGSRT